MSTLSGILSIASTALQTAQTGLNVVSDNVSNVNTTGYVRKLVEQQSISYAGQGAGVNVARIIRVADQYLQQASLNATSASGRYGAISSNLDQAQKLFGDPSTASSLFGQLDGIFSSFSALASAPSSVTRSQSLAAAKVFFSSASQISLNLQSLQSQTQTAINNDVTKVNELLKKISDLNIEIGHGSNGLQDITGYQNQQSQYVDQLSKLVDIRISQDGGAEGVITVRASDGTALTSPGRDPAVFSYDQTNGTGQLFFTPPGGALQPYGSRLTSGEIEGLLHAANTDLPNVAQQLGEFAASAAAALNQASNTYSATPAPASLTGKDIGIDLTSALTGFKGMTNFAIVNASGVVQSKVTADFNAGTLTDAAGNVSNFTPATFVSALNAALSPGGGASATGNILSLTASGGNGIVVADDPTTPSSGGGKGFSQYFGLNDIVKSQGQTDYDTGLTPSVVSGFTTGVVKFRIAGPDGTQVADISVTPTAGQSVAQLVTQLNSTTQGLGVYGTFGLDTYGAVTFTPKVGSGTQLAVISDTTSWNGTGPSLTQLFGLDPIARSNRAQNLSVNTALIQQPGGIPNAALRLPTTAGSVDLAAGDTRGSDALARAGTVIRSFHPSGGAPASSTSLSNYAASFSAQVATAASSASDSQKNADAQAAEAQSRRSGVEGVNIDQELISLTTYQQAYNASARLLTAAKDMYDTLLQLVQ